MMVEVAAARTTTVLGPAHDDTKNAVRNVATWSGRWCEAGAPVMELRVRQGESKAG